MTEPRIFSNDPRIFSDERELSEIASSVHAYARLPFSSDSIPGRVLEVILANVREAKSLGTYDFVDVVKSDADCGWQVKSTKSDTPVTWKRAKIPDAARLIVESETSEEAIQELGKRIIEFCNDHIWHSFEKYNLEEIGYARLIVYPSRSATYFERKLVTAAEPRLFEPEDFYWKWSVQKQGTSKEQLSALHGYLRESDQKWFAWHGRGENQLHFTGEGEWWPETDTAHAVHFDLPSEEQMITYQDFAELLDRLDREN